MTWRISWIGDKRDGLFVGSSLIVIFFILFVLLAPPDEVFFPEPRSELFLLIALSGGIGVVTGAVCVYRFGIEYSSHSKMIVDSVVGFYSIIALIAVLLMTFFITDGIVTRISAGENPVVVIISGIFGGLFATLIFFVPMFGFWYGYVSSLMIVGFLVGYVGLLGVSSVGKAVGS